ncbi:hypothetical protein, partial [Nocardia farcinica]|uniref:hypothetical protein n=1 Tax=Nocardia farcinica TaxID=37329 RepID=UPI0024552002
MTLIELPQGVELRPEFGGGYAAIPIDGLPGCYEGLTGWIEFQWPGYTLDDYANEGVRRAWWRAREEIMDALADDERPVFPPELEWDAYPPTEYGIGDTPQQVMAHPALEWVRTDPRDFIVVFTEVRREDQPPRDGWRFHKHGDYIGVHNVEWEYLAEQDGERGERIDSVVMYHVIHVQP